MSGIKTIEQITAELKSNALSGITEPLIKAPQGLNSLVSNKPVLNQVNYDVHAESIFKRLNDGSYISRFDDYKGGDGNEARLAANQSSGEKWGHGVTKFVGKALNYAAQATVGTIYGVGATISSGDSEDFYNNDFANYMDDLDTKLDNNLANYYSDEEKSMNFLEKMGTANFWANDFTGALAFVAGALLPEAALALATGGSSLSVTIPKAFARAGFKSAFKSGSKKLSKEALETIGKNSALGVDDLAKKLAKFNSEELAVDITKGLRRANYGKKIGTVLNTTRFLIQTSAFEAGMESRHNLHSSTEDYLKSFELKNGRPPSFDEYNEFTMDAVSAANKVFVANMAILSVSNVAMFGKTFGVGFKTGKKVKNFGNRAIGLGHRREGTKRVLNEASIGKRLVGNAYLVLSKPAVEGLFEEGLQGVAGTTMQNYLNSKYDPSVEAGYNAMSAMTDAFAHQYGTKEGWNEIGIGMLIGFAGGGLQGQLPTGFGKSSRKSRFKRLKGQIDLVNESQDSHISRLNSANSANSFSNLKESGSENLESGSMDNVMLDAAYIQAQEQVKTPNQILEDHNAIVDNMELSTDQIDEIGGKENIEEYKNTLKSSFKTSLKNYGEAKKAVGNLGLDIKLGKDSIGNVKEVGQALLMNIMMGRDALSTAEVIASQIGTVVGIDGIFNHMEFFNNLSQEKKESLDTIKKKKRKSKALRKKAEKYLREIQGLPKSGTREFSDKTKNNRYLTASDEYVAINKQIEELDAEIEVLGEALKADGSTLKDFDPNNLTNITNNHDVDGMIEELDKLEGYIDALRKTNRGKDADSIVAMIEDFKAHSDAHREMNNTFRSMTDTNFFSRKEGKGLISMIVGDRYSMSPEFRQIIKDNNAVIDKSLRLVKYRGAERVEKIIEESIESNENLSEREKYRLESLIRLQLGYKKVADKVNKIVEEIVIAETQDKPSIDPLKGDKIEVVEQIDTEGKDLGSVAVLDEIINKITDELDSFKNKKLAGLKAKELNIQLDRLKRKRGRIKEESIEEILEDEYKEFVDNGTVSEPRLIDIADKIKKGDGLSVKEEAMRAAKNDQVEDLLQKTSKRKSDEEIDTEIEALEAEVKTLKEQAEVKIVNSEEFIRLDELSKKMLTEDLDETEAMEHASISATIDQWIEVSGTEVGGFRLSELIQQKAVLENTGVLPVETVKTPTSQEVIESSEIADKGDSVNYDLGQTYDGVTVIKNKKGETEIAGITWKEFIELAGIPLSEVKTKGKGIKEVPVAPFTTNAQGNILLTDELVDTINGGSRLSIRANNKGVDGNYSMVLITTVNDNGSKDTKVLKTNYEFSNDMVPEGVYDMQPGEEVKLEVSPTDPHNERLIKKYKRAKTKPDKEKAKKEMRDGLVIRVLNKNGKFVAVLKAKRDGGKKNQDVADKFEALRDGIINDDKFFEILIEQQINRELKQFKGITVKEVFIGHPNFNYTENTDGSISIVSKKLTKIGIKKIEDTGYVQGGKLDTMSGKNDGIDKRLLRKTIREAKPEDKIPFVIVRKGAQRIAIPIKIEAKSKESLEEFRNIFESESNASNKASALNIFMAEKGLDIREKGNAFFDFGEKNNLTDKFFSEKLAELESINYFRDITDLANSKLTKEGVLKEGVSSEINLSIPVHSPKVKLDFKGLDIKISKKSTTSKDKATTKVKEAVSIEALKGLDESLKNAKEKDC